MRRLPTLLITGVVLVAASCGSEPDPTPPVGTPPSTTPQSDPPPFTGPAPSSPATNGPAPGNPATGRPAPSDTSTTPPKPGPQPTSTGFPTPPGPGELPEELPHGRRVLTGVVQRSGSCLVLDVGEQRWGLTGTKAEGLRVGARVTVEGQVTTAGAGCALPGTARAIVVRRVTPG